MPECASALGREECAAAMGRRRSSGAALELAYYRDIKERRTARSNGLGRKDSAAVSMSSARKVGRDRCTRQSAKQSHRCWGSARERPRTSSRTSTPINFQPARALLLAMITSSALHPSRDVCTISARQMHVGTRPHSDLQSVHHHPIPEDGKPFRRRRDQMCSLPP
jgi:hypothetical protein